MQFGIMIRGHHDRSEDMTRRFAELCEQVRTADRLGFASITKGSHYSTDPWQSFQQLPFLARMSAEGPKLRLNAGIILLPLHKPLDLAEQLATIDIMSGGRLIAGFGLGYREVEFQAFGTTQRERVRRFEENLEAIRRLWTGDPVTMTGSHFSLRNAICSAKPVQQPHPPIWIGANADAGIRRAARLGSCWYINPHNTIASIRRQMDVYRDALDKAGRRLPAELPIRREVFVAATHEEAIRISAPYLMQQYASYSAWGQAKDMPEEDADLTAEFTELARDRFLIGTADGVAGQIVALARETGVNHIVMSIQWYGMPQTRILETMHRLAEEVFPKVHAELGSGPQ